MYFPRQKFYEELDEGEIFPSPKILDEDRETLEKSAKLLEREKAELEEVVQGLEEINVAAKADKYNRRFGHVERVNKSALKRRREELLKDIPLQESIIAEATKRLFENLDRVSIRTSGDGFRVVDTLRVLDGQAKSEADRGAMLSKVLTSQIFDNKFYFKLDEFLMENTQFLSGVLFRKEKDASEMFETSARGQIAELFLATKDFGENGGFVYNLIKKDVGYRERFFEIEYNDMQNILPELNKEDRKFFKEEFHKYQVHSGKKNRAGDQIVRDTGSVIEGIGKFVNGTIKVVTAPVVLLGKGLKKLNASASRQAVYKKNRDAFMEATKQVLKDSKVGNRGIKAMAVQAVVENGQYLLRIHVNRQRKAKRDTIMFDYPVPEGEGRTIEQLIGERRFFAPTKKPTQNEDDKLMRYIAHATVKNKAQSLQIIEIESVSDDELTR